MSSYGGDEYYTVLARKKSLRARSYFKLEEMNTKYRLFHKNQCILDLGGSPGSWVEYLLNVTRGKVRVVTVDIQRIEPFSQGGVTCLQEDVSNLRKESLPYRWYDAVISDMGCASTGIGSLDSARSCELVKKAACLAEEVLLSGGVFLAKYLEGGEKGELFSFLKGIFSALRSYRPRATRKHSKEIYIIGKKEKKKVNFTSCQDDIDQ